MAKHMDPVKCLCGSKVDTIPDSASWEEADEYQEAGWAFEHKCGAPLFIPAAYVKSARRGT